MTKKYAVLELDYTELEQKLTECRAQSESLQKRLTEEEKEKQKLKLELANWKDTQRLYEQEVNKTIKLEERERVLREAIKQELMESGLNDYGDAEPKLGWYERLGTALNKTAHLIPGGEER